MPPSWRINLIFAGRNRVHRASASWPHGTADEVPKLCWVPWFGTPAVRCLLARISVAFQYQRLLSFTFGSRV